MRRARIVLRRGEGFRSTRLGAGPNSADTMMPVESVKVSNIVPCQFQEWKRLEIVVYCDGKSRQRARGGCGHSPTNVAGSSRPRRRRTQQLGQQRPDFHLSDYLVGVAR